MVYANLFIRCISMNLNKFSILLVDLHEIREEMLGGNLFYVRTPFRITKLHVWLKQTSIEYNFKSLDPSQIGVKPF